MTFLSPSPSLSPSLSLSLSPSPSLSLPLSFSSPLSTSSSLPSIVALPLNNVFKNEIKLFTPKKKAPTICFTALKTNMGFGGIEKGINRGLIVRKREDTWQLPAKRTDGKKGEGGGGEEILDEDLRTGLNEVSDEALRVMLSDDLQRLSAFKKKVDYYGEFLVAEGELDAARFMLVIQGMLDHKVIEEHEDLKGPYKKAFDRIWSLMEDSGWLLAIPGQEEEANPLEMAEEELMPPVLRPY